MALVNAVVTCGSRFPSSSRPSCGQVDVLSTCTVAKQRQSGLSTSYVILKSIRSMEKSIKRAGCCSSVSVETTRRLNVPLRLCNTCSTATITTPVLGSVHTDFTFCNAVSRPSTNRSLTANSRPSSSRSVVVGK